MNQPKQFSRRAFLAGAAATTAAALTGLSACALDLSLIHI